MGYAQLFKKIVNNQPILKTDYESLKGLTEKNLLELQTIYKSFKEKKEFSEVKEDLHGFNKKTYEQLLPLTQLACRLENNVGAELHAKKLATLFSSVDDALTYLEKFEKENRDRPQMIHDACLFSLPEGNQWNVKLWQDIAKNNMPNKKFEKILPFAKKIEDYVNKNRKELENKAKQSVRSSYELKLSQDYDRLEQQEKRKKESTENAPPKNSAEQEKTRINRIIENRFKKYLIEKLGFSVLRNGKLKEEDEAQLKNKAVSEEDIQKKKEIIQQVMDEEEKSKKLEETKRKEKTQKETEKKHKEMNDNVEKEFKQFLMKKYAQDLSVDDRGNLTKQARERLRNISEQLSETDQNKKKEITDRIRNEFQQKEARQKAATTSVNLAKNEIIKLWLERDEREIEAACKTACHRVLDSFISPETLFEYAQNIAYARANENPEAAKLFFEHGVGEKEFNEYLSLKIGADNPTQIPDVMIDGTELGYPGFYIKKLSRRDPRAAILGEITSCCQSLGNAGEDCAINGITSPNAGFYVLCRKEGTMPAPSDPIHGQCWVWRGQQGNIVFDSIESQINFQQHGNNRSMIADMYTYLAYSLVTHHSVPKVYVGARSGTSDDLGFPINTTTELPINYKKHRDSYVQKIVAAQNEPLVDICFRLNSKVNSELVKSKQDILLSKKLFEELNQDDILFRAVIKGDFELIKRLVELNANVNVRKLDHVYNKTVLALAVEAGNKNIVEYLVDHGAVIDDQCLLEATKKNNVELIKYLVNLKANINAVQEFNNTTVLDFAVEFSDKNTVEYLVDHGAIVDEKSLLMAAKKNNFELTKYLIELWEKSVKSNENRYSKMLEWAVQHGNKNMMEYLIDHGAAVKYRVVLEAIVRGDFELIKRFVELSKKEEISQDDHLVMVECATSRSNKNKNIMEYIVNQWPSFSGTALIIAARNNAFELVKYIVEHMDVNVNNLSRALEEAVENKNKQIIEYLVEHDVSFGAQELSDFKRMFDQEFGGSEFLEYLKQLKENREKRTALILHQFKKEASELEKKTDEKSKKDGEPRIGNP